LTCQLGQEAIWSAAGPSQQRRRWPTASWRCGCSRSVSFDGERVRVVARGHPGGDPVAVRVGNTMFALRRFEAERVLVAPLWRVA
jgi:hypothetical protein